MLRLILVLSCLGAAQCNTTPLPSEQGADPTEWDCSVDHRPDPDNPRNYLLSAGGFGEDAPVVVATCATPLLRFTQNGGVCRCEYIQELQDLLDQECQIRVPSGAPTDEFQLIVPNLVRETIDELYVTRSCFSVLPNYIADAYRAAGVIPLFFNETGCRCDWVPGVDRSIEASAVRPPESQCVRLVDQSYSGEQVSSDEVGNFIQVFPSSMQTNLTVRDGGAFFDDGGLIATVSWALMGVDFVDINLVATFDSSSNVNDQLIFSNMCEDRADGIGGIVVLTYSPSARRYNVQFFNQQATCTAVAPPGQQTVQLIYREGSLSLVVNNMDCDISSINPIANPEERLTFNSRCPFQQGGNVFTNVTRVAAFGRDAQISQGFRGVYNRFMVLSNCENPPQFIQDRIMGMNPIAPSPPR